MDKKSKQGKNVMSIILVVELLLILLDILLFVFSVLNLLFFILSLIVLVAVISLTILKIVKDRKKQKEKAKVEPLSVKQTEQDLIDLYNRAGIPVLYDENGKLKDIFELLKIEAMYDKSGNRLKTIYELLGIVPRFDKDGKEIPTFLSIKNRVKGFVKPEKKTGDLTRVLTEEQKEDLLLKQMLKEKLQESIKNGDEQKTKAIKKVIDNQKKKSAEIPAKKADVIKLATGKVVGFPKSKLASIKSGGQNIINDLMTATTLVLGKTVYDGILQYGIDPKDATKTGKIEGFHRLKSKESSENDKKNVHANSQAAAAHRIPENQNPLPQSNKKTPVRKSIPVGAPRTGLKAKIQENREKGIERI